MKLKREVGLWGALLLGLGSILGTGAYAIIPTVTSSLGGLTILAILFAGVLATCNGLNSAQPARAYPKRRHL